MAVTLDDVVDDLVEHADFEATGSVASARKFVTAATRYLILSPQQQSDQGSSLTMSVIQIENLLRRGREFVSQNATATANTSAVRFLSASEGFRR